MEFHPGHFDELRRSLPGSQPAVGANLRAWAASLRPAGAPDKPLIPRETLARLPDGQVDRAELRACCAELDEVTAFLAVSAWGGMRRTHGALAWGARNRWAPTLAALRQPGGSRVAAYQAMSDAQHSRNLPGIGVAYFTKLLFFLRPEADAYILDQWTARSVNLLLQRPVIALTRSQNGPKVNYWVNHENRSDRYQRYCEVIEALSAQLACGPEETEIALMSNGAHPGPVGRWRAHVIAQI